jgi:hypothetical protein
MFDVLHVSFSTCQVLVLSPLKESLKIGEEYIIGVLYLLIQLVSLSHFSYSFISSAFVHLISSQLALGSGKGLSQYQLHSNMVSVSLESDLIIWIKQFNRLFDGTPF